MLLILFVLIDFTSGTWLFKSLNPLTVSVFTSCTKDDMD